MREGGCYCGAVRFLAEGEPTLVSYCHCRDCRRLGGAPAAVFVGFARGAVTFRGKPRAFRSSAHVTRRFCPECGSPLAYEDHRLAGEVYLALGAFDAPERLRPSRHAFAVEQLPWLEIADELPRHPGFSKPRPE